MQVKKILLFFSFLFFGINISEGATITFQKIFRSTSAGYDTEDNQITIASAFNDGPFTFTDAGDAAQFSGNNVNGYITTSSGNRIYGIISRLFKTGSTVEAFYFRQTDSFFDESTTNYAFVLVGNDYGNLADYNSSTTRSLRTSSDPVATALNNYLGSIPSATISATSLTPFSSCYNTASAAQTFTVSGSNLVSDITITSPTGYEVSSDGSNYSSSLTLTESSGTVNSTTIYARMSAGTSSPSIGDINISATNAATKTVAVSGTINAQVTLSGASSVVVSSTITLTGSGTAASSNPYVSSDPSVATVNSSGLVTGISAGTTTITYTDNAGCTASKLITVTTTLSPSLTISTTNLSQFQACANTSSSAQTFTVSGSNLSADIILTAPTGFEISLDGNSYSGSLTLQESSGSVSSTTIYARMKSLATSPSNGNIVLSTTGASNENIAVSGSVIPASVAGTISGTTTTCYNTNTILSLSGNTGLIQWQISSDNSTWNNISGATNATYNTGNLTSTTYYRAISTSGACTSATTSSITVTVNAQVTLSGANTAEIGFPIQLTGSGTAASSNAYISSDTTVATVDANGVVTGISAGTTTITYTDNAGCTATKTITIGIPVDTDGDGVPDAQEVIDGTDPNDGCDYREASISLITSVAWRNLDCDGDGNPNGSDPAPRDFCTGGVSGVIPALNSTTYNTYFREGDCDGDGISNHLETNGSGLPIDTDEDGIPNYLDIDSDNDGILDSIEKNIHTDSDGIADYQDLDSDNDGIPDSVEKGVDGPVDTDNDGMPDYVDIDSDNDFFKDAWENIHNLDYSRDSDYDGYVDINGVFIDTNHNGWLDELEGYTQEDTDNDSIPDYLDADSDNDCLPDFLETGDDIDGDFYPGWRDNDSDGDGIPENIETVDCRNPIDTDGDGLPDFRDLDSDNDGIPDAVEKGEDGNNPVDTDGDGLPDYRDLDSDNDGIPDKVEKGSDGNNPVDTDGDGLPDYRDLDSDNDGIPDTIEKGSDGNNPVDTDGDGLPDYRDLDSDNDGIPDKVEKGSDGNNPVDTDGDGLPDYRDLDSDNDGIPDKVEKGSDGNNPVDTDGDGLPDYRDLDSDNDGIPDKVEKGSDGNNPVDTDGDGLPDYRDLDSDNDGFSDEEEKGSNGDNPRDSDGDGIPDYREVDSDGDGILDNEEDSLENGDLADCDNDGIPNRLDDTLCEVYLPQGISPNGDGINDTLIIPGIARRGGSITIFNRWGAVVYENQNYQNEWNGQTNTGYKVLEVDNLLPDGVYYYILNLRDGQKVGTYVQLNRIR